MVSISFDFREGHYRRTELAFLGGADNADCVVDAQRLRTVWIRPNASPLQPKPDDSLGGAAATFARLESKRCLDAFWQVTADQCFWISPIPAISAAESKPLQLVRAEALGFRIPATLFTNRPDEAKAFCEALRWRVVYKPFSSMGFNEHLEKAWGIYTSHLSKSNVPIFSTVKYAPCIFQEEICKCFDVRVTVIGDQVIAASINASASPSAALDWRRYDLARTVFGSHELPQRLEDLCRALVRSFGLAFGCIDLVVSQEGEYFFPEINPTGQWYFLELQVPELRLADTFVNMVTNSIA